MVDRIVRLPRLPALSGLATFTDTVRNGEWLRAALPRSRPRFSLTRGELILLAWRILWLPFWLGSDVPAPRLPARNVQIPAGIGLAGEQVVRIMDRLRRRIWAMWIMTTIVRAAWLTGLVGCGWFLVERWGGPKYDSWTLLYVGIGIVAVGAVFAIINRPTRQQTARMLDRSFHLHERMTTALDNLGRGVPTQGERAQLIYLQVADAANVVGELRRQPAFRLRPPLRELVLGLTCALVLTGLFFLRGIDGGIPDLSAANIPVFSPAAQRMKPPPASSAAGAAPNETEDAPTSEEIQERAQRSNEAQRDLSTLGEALDDHAATRSAAESIAQGDYDQAAEELRDLSSQADQLSQESRDALADDLDAAAAQMSPGSSDLANATREAAEGLREGGEPAQQGVQELGDAVQETGNEVATQQEIRDQIAQSQANSNAQSQSENGQTGDQGDQNGSADSGQEGDSQQVAGDQGDGDPRRGEGGTDAEQSGQDPGEGADAEPGRSRGQQQSADRGSNPGTTQNPGGGEARGRDRSAASDSASPGEGQPQPGTSGGAPGDIPPEGDPTGQTSADAQQGAGAGSGEGQENPNTGGGETGNDPTGAEGLPAEQRVTEANQTVAAAEQPEPESGETVLELDDTGGQGIQTSNNGGSATSGAGTGVMTASGNSTQQEVGAAGPDSNRVPSQYRDVVEDYFSDPDDSQ